MNVARVACIQASRTQRSILKVRVRIHQILTDLYTPYVTFEDHFTRCQVWHVPYHNDHTGLASLNHDSLRVKIRTWGNI